ncbi:hypothetical protein Pmani_025193 [Petrolisthes manimaculis]|uniref:Uncharacterized protein n=1 Tax=Petrolisthes manimaculis TaxID=1843537 RepID=A0AAE1U1E5_9EUCA|nr:hypothetical protein Pmani_025193 [Petrolisthes manimaculis]
MAKRKSKNSGRVESWNEKKQEQLVLPFTSSSKGNKRVKQQHTTHVTKSCKNRARKKVCPIQLLKTYSPYAVPIMFPTPPSPEHLPIPEFPNMHQSGSCQDGIQYPSRSSPECLQVCPNQLSKTYAVQPSPEFPNLHPLQSPPQCLPVPEEFPNLHQSHSCQDWVSNILHRQPKKNIYQSLISKTCTQHVCVKNVSSIHLHHMSHLIQSHQAYLDLAICAQD